MGETGENPKPYTKDQLKAIGMVDPQPGFRPTSTGSIKLEVRGDDVVTVETPKSPELNIIVKRWAKVKSPLGEAMLSSGLAKKGE
jgi:hypothetical protein